MLVKRFNVSGILLIFRPQSNRFPMNNFALTGPASSFIFKFAVRSYIFSEPTASKGWGL